MNQTKSLIQALKCLDDASRHMSEVVATIERYGGGLEFRPHVLESPETALELQRLAMEMVSEIAKEES